MGLDDKSVLLLLLLTVMLGAIVQNPEAPCRQFAVAAALGGLGGGIFSSSTTGLGYFYPDNKKGAALRIRTAGGSLNLFANDLNFLRASPRGQAHFVRPNVLTVEEKRNLVTTGD